MTTPASDTPARPPDPAVVALGRTLDRAVRQLATLDANVRALAVDVSTLTETAPGRDSVSGPPSVRSWLAATDPDQAIADLADLIDWVNRVYLRYSRALFSTCWLWHPEAIEELWWLRCAHAEAYHPDTGTWLRVGDWHDRQRPGVQTRLNQLLGTCSLTRHVDRNNRHADVFDPQPAPLTGVHPQIATAWTTFRAAGPVPTAEHLREADDYENPRPRNHR